MKKKRLGAFEKRIHEVDFIRGILIIIVILDHLFWFFKSYTFNWFGDNPVYQVTNFYWTSGARQLIRQLVLFLFVFISGLSCGFSKNNWKRAGKMLLVWALLSVISNIADRLLNGAKGTWIVDFNVIGVLAWSVLIYCFCQKMSWKGLTAVMLICILLTMSISLIPADVRYDTYVPSLWAPNMVSKITGDWMPLFPYIAFFFMGAIMTKFIYKDKKSLFKRYEWERSFCFVGRNTIWVYLLHEPILLAIFGLVGLIVTGA